jgi:ribonucleotide reductase beta subunit family protein with ferritin-like domain
MEYTVVYKHYSFSAITIQTGSLSAAYEFMCVQQEVHEYSYSGVLRNHFCSDFEDIYKTRYDAML